MSMTAWVYGALCSSKFAARRLSAFFPKLVQGTHVWYIFGLLARDVQAKLALIVAQCLSTHLSICVSVRDSLSHAYVYVRSITCREACRLPAFGLDHWHPALCVSTLLATAWWGEGINATINPHPIPSATHVEDSSVVLPPPQSLCHCLLATAAPLVSRCLSGICVGYDRQLTANKNITQYPILPNTGRYWPISNTPMPIAF